MERKIGEIFEHNGEWYQCVGGTCRNCSFYYDTVCKNIITIGSTNFGNCHCSLRTDHKSVIFKKLEKVGEPYEFDGHLFQSYRTFEEPIFTENYATVRELGNNSKISIEIKQNKEDMEEKNLTYEELLHYYHSTVGLWAIDRNPQEVNFDWVCENAFRLGIDEETLDSHRVNNLKPFDLEAAKQGKSVCTRDGRKARIICFNADPKGRKHIIALVTTVPNEMECVFPYFMNGRFYENRDSEDDLMMLPEKKEGWVNVYKGGLLDTKVYNTRQEAFEKASQQDYVATVEIEWEE